MAYTPINWQTGDTITAEKMNKMDNGWSISNTQLFSETVTTVELVSGIYGAGLTYSQHIDNDTINVTFDGTDYTCPLIDDDGVYFYGGFNDGPDFTEYPFFIEVSSSANTIYTETAGTHTVAASAEGVEVSDNFSAAVSAVSPIDVSTLPLRCVSGTTTADEMYAAMDAGRLLYFGESNDRYIVTSMNGSRYDDTEAVNFIPEVSSNIMTAGFDSDGIFHIYYM